jgi:hypothetical protein
VSAAVSRAKEPPRQEAGRIAYESLPPHPANVRGEAETVCRVCGYPFDRDVPTCAGSLLRSMRDGTR